MKALFSIVKNGYVAHFEFSLEGSPAPAGSTLMLLRKSKQPPKINLIPNFQTGRPLLKLSRLCGPFKFAKPLCDNMSCK